jgi:hypothetical protein
MKIYLKPSTYLILFLTLISLSSSCQNQSQNKIKTETEQRFFPIGFPKDNVMRRLGMGENLIEKVPGKFKLGMDLGQEDTTGISMIAKVRYDERVFRSGYALFADGKCVGFTQLYSETSQLDKVIQLFQLPPQWDHQFQIGAILTYVWDNDSIHYEVGIPNQGGLVINAWDKHYIAP